MSRVNYKQHEQERNGARRALHAAILRDVEARLNACGDRMNGYDLADSVFDWELEAFEELRQRILGPFAYAVEDHEVPPRHDMALDAAWDAYHEHATPDGQTCDWGECDFPVVALRLDDNEDGQSKTTGFGWLPVCERHRALDSRKELPLDWMQERHETVTR